MKNGWREGWKVAWSRPFVRRGLKIMAIVGAVQIAINHGDALLRGDIDLERSIRMVLTASVPYCVATISGVVAHLNALHQPAGASSERGA